MNKNLKRRILFFAIVFMFIASSMQTSAANYDEYTVKLVRITKNSWPYQHVSSFEVKFLIVWSGTTSTTTHIGPDWSGTQVSETGYEMYSVRTHLFYNGDSKDYKTDFVHDVISPDSLSFTLDYNGYVFTFTNTFIPAIASPPPGGCMPGQECFDPMD